MAGSSRIKGITIEIDGQTTGLQKALNSITKESISIQKELNDVNKLLKFDPGNTELLSQKQQLLSKSVETTKEKLTQLKAAQEQVNQQFANGEINESQYQAFQREIIDTEARLKSLESTLKSTSPELQSFGTKAAQAGEQLNKIGGNLTSTGKTLTTGVTLPLVGVAAAAVKVGNDFESAMSRVKAISGATGDEFEKLKQQALDLGQSTAFSAKEVASAQENLASAGFTTTEIMQALPGLLDLAASSGEDLATSSDIAASTLRGFGLDASQAAHVADVLAKNAADTNAAVADTGEAMKYVAPAAKAAGLSLEEVTAAIGVMANSGIQGSQAGTTLRSSLTRLASPSKEAAGLMEQLGFNAFDSNGKMISLSEIINNLQKSTAGLTDEQKQNAIATIFGQEAMSGMLTLMDAGGDQINTLADGLKNADGAASKMAKTMQDNTSSAIEQMFGALETAGIKIQEALAPAITAIANAIGNMASAFSNLSPTAQKVIITIAGIVAAIGPLLIIIGKLLTIGGMIAQAIGVMTGAVTVATPAVTALAAVFTALTGPIGIVIAVITGVIAALVLLWNNSETFRTIVIAIWEGIKEAVSTFATALIGFFTVTIPGAFNSLVTFFQSIPSTFTALWESIKTAFINGWNAIVSFFTESVPAWIESIAEWFNQLPEKIAYALGFALGATVSWGANMISWITTTVPQWIDNIQKIFSELPGKLWAIFLDVTLKIGTWGLNILSWITTNVPQWINTITTFFSELPGKIWTWLVNVVTNVKTWGSNMLTEAKSGMQNVFNGIVDTFKNLPSKMLDIGKNIVAGIKNGIKAAWDGMVGWIGGLCDSFVDGIKDALDIHSPSRVTEALGEYTGEGFKIGIASTVGDISKQADALANAAIPNVQQGEYSTSVNGLNTNNLTGSTGETLEKLLAKIDSLQNAISNMGIYMDKQKVGKIITSEVSGNLAFNNGRKGW